MNQFETAMSAALELATRGPEFGGNPQVGAVLLDPSGTIAAEGWHEGAGTDHAEVMALRNLREKLSLGQDDRLMGFADGQHGHDVRMRRLSGASSRQ